MESDFSLFIESMKLAGHGTEYPAVIPKSMGDIQIDKKTANLFIKDTDIVNYDTIRQAFYQMSAYENPEVGFQYDDSAEITHHLWVTSDSHLIGWKPI